jgi:hypothetical protein
MHLLCAWSVSLNAPTLQTCCACFQQCSVTVTARHWLVCLVLPCCCFKCMDQPLTSSSCPPPTCHNRHFPGSRQWQLLAVACPRSPVPWAPDPPLDTLCCPLSPPLPPPPPRRCLQVPVSGGCCPPPGLLPSRLWRPGGLRGGSGRSSPQVCRHSRCSEPGWPGRPTEQGKHVLMTEGWEGCPPPPPHTHTHTNTQAQELLRQRCSCSPMACM